MVDIVVFIAFLMVFMRITAMIGTVSVFFPTGTPNLAKVGMGLLMAMIVTPVIDVNSIPTITNTGTLIVLMGKEIILGLCLGYICLLYTSRKRKRGPRLYRKGLRRRRIKKISSSMCYIRSTCTG